MAASDTSCVAIGRFLNLSVYFLIYKVRIIILSLLLCG